MNFRTDRSILCWLALCGAGCAVLGGCYDAHALIEQVRADAIRNRLDEVDLGTYRTTMPRDPHTNALVEMELQLFGTVPQYRIGAIERQLQTEGYRLRYEILAAIRQATADELIEPDLAGLRGRLTQVVNQVLTKAPVKTIGIENFRILND